MSGKISSEYEVPVPKPKQVYQGVDGHKLTIEDAWFDPFTDFYTVDFVLHKGSNHFEELSLDRGDWEEFARSIHLSLIKAED